MTKSLCELGWKPFFQQQLTENEMESCIPVRITAHHRSQIVTESDHGEQAFAIALLNKLAPITVGDWLLIDQLSMRPVRLLERQSLLQRKAAGEYVDQQLMAANIDTLLIVSSCNQEFNLSRLERYLSIALEAGVMAIVVLTKADLAEDVEPYREQVKKLRAGLIVESINAFDQSTLSGVLAWCHTGQTLAMLGSSGVGKSTLATALGAAEQTTSTIREDDQKGRHTTTWRSLLHLAHGGILIDNPGIRELQLTACEEGVNELFSDVLDYANCRYANCSHTNEPGCNVRKAIETDQLDKRRLVNYQKLLAEQQRNSESLSDKRKRMKQLGKSYKSIQTASRQRKNRS